MVLVHDTLSHCVLQVYKFQPNSVTVFNLQSGHEIPFTYITKGDNLKNIYAKVMVLVHSTSSQCALQMYEVSLKYL